MSFIKQKKVNKILLTARKVQLADEPNFNLQFSLTPKLTKINIDYTTCQFGKLVVFFNDTDIYGLTLVRDFDQLEDAKLLIKNKFGDCEIANSDLADFFNLFAGNPVNTNFYLHFCGTEFQQSVWQQLSLIPPKSTISYLGIANKINKPKSARAVGNAVGDNPFFFLAPCHRVLTTNNKIGGFAHGVDIKKQLLNLDEVSL